MGRYKIIGFLWLLLLTAGAQAQPGQMKGWSLSSPLLWSDFKGRPDSPQTPYAATTFAGLQLEVKEVSFSGQVSFKVRAVFDCSRSWAHPERLDEAVLAHEQLHFDITEAYARRLERKLNLMKLKVRDKEVAKKLLAQYQRAQLKEQQQFDKACVHGLNRKNEAQWRHKIDRELNIRREAMKLASQ